jgi:hypothetical protein
MNKIFFDFDIFSIYFGFEIIFQFHGYYSLWSQKIAQNNFQDRNKELKFGIVYLFLEHISIFNN